MLFRSYAALENLFTSTGITFILSPRPTGTDSDELPVALLAMIPELCLKTSDFTIDFKNDRLVNPQFEDQVRDYFFDLSAKFGSNDLTQLDTMSSVAPLQPGAAESLATFLFRYQFYLLTKSALQAARDLLTSSIASIATPCSLNTIINLYNNNYTTRANDSLDKIAQMFGVTVDSLCAANPTLAKSAPKLGDRLFVPSNELKYISQTNDNLAALAEIGRAHV